MAMHTEESPKSMHTNTNVHRTLQGDDTKLEQRHKFLHQIPYQWFISHLSTACDCSCPQVANPTQETT
jgi:hypothetical protein